MSRIEPITTVGSQSVSRYDLLLAALPIPLLLGIGSGVLTDLPLAAAAGLGSVPSALLLAYGLFVHAPRPERMRERGRST
ncbi:hypothetical protein [Halobellus rufus]|uniref:hypothetical protein n=1 Tax=Halobellus rufus TaxID=1448860 RepID=UPI0012E04BE1|nr:hypothetical protein [Halobellus rufus]